MSRFRRLVKKLKLPPLSLPDTIVSPLQLPGPLNKTRSRRSAVIEPPASTSDFITPIVMQPPNWPQLHAAKIGRLQLPQVDPLPRQSLMNPVATAKIESLPTREFRVTIADTTDKLLKTAKWLRLKPQKA